MTPKEKADELFKKMLSKNPNIQDGISRIDTIQAKLCALVAVDEILELTKRPTYNPFDWNEITGVRYDKYWEKIKQEIENL